MTLKSRFVLGSAASNLWAKTGSEDQWHSLASHMVDAAQMGVRLWEDWLALSTRRWLAEPVGSDEAGRALFAWLAGCHDLGKASPAFQIQVPALAAQVCRTGLPLPSVLPERSKAPHAKVSAVAIGPLLAERFGWDRRFTVGPAAILGGHHGWFPEEGFSAEGRKRPSLYGWSDDQDAPWMAARRELFDLIVAVTSADSALHAGAGIELGRARELALSGYVILADWLASNAGLFPYASVAYAPPYIEESTARAGRALQSIGWRRWDAPATRLDFIQRFTFAPNALQEQTIATATRATEPGLLIIEAPMGVGKTEASLAAVEVLARTQGFGGTFIALPTQATSNQMFLRARKWLEHFESGTYVMELAHGKADQIADYRALGGTPVSIDVDEGHGAQVTAADWFHGSKRRLLAPFVVGTIDQALLCAAKVRHVALRQVGLVGKVVVVDEVHAYDAHMSVFLRRALRWLGAAKVPVVLLSATLPPVTRRRLIEAYVGSAVEVGEISYPAVVHIAPSGEVTSSPVTSEGPPKRARIQVLTERGGGGGKEVTDVVTSLVRREANVLVVRNTVVRAQETYRALVNVLGEGAVTLLHARFLVDHRLKKEAWLAAHFGPSSNRPHGHVVVGTQVLEQSLDVDFDVLVTDLAPIDLVFQRMGRVHRHPGVHRPKGFEEPFAIVTGLVRVSTGPPEFPRGSLAVYAEHLLLRTSALLVDRESITLPDEVPVLVTRVYGEETITPSTWAQRAAAASAAWREAQLARERAAEQFAIPAPEGAPNLLELCRIGIGDRDDDDPAVQAAVRDSTPAIEVVIGWGSGSLDLIDALGGKVPLDHRPTPEEMDHALGSTLRLPSRLTSAALAELHTPSGWRENPWLRHLRVLVLSPKANEAPLGKNVLRYSEALGLEATSRGG